MLRPKAITPRYRFLVLLVAMVLLLLVTPLVQFVGGGRYPVLRGSVTDILFAVMLLAAVFAVSERRIAVIAGGILVVPAVLLQGLYILE